VGWHGLVKDSLLRLAAMITTGQSDTGVPRPSLVNMLMLCRPTPHPGDARTKAVPDHELYKDLLDGPDEQRAEVTPELG